MVPQGTNGPESPLQRFVSKWCPGGPGTDGGGADTFPPGHLFNQPSPGFHVAILGILSPREILLKKKKNHKSTQSPCLIDRETGEEQSSITRRHSQEAADGASKQGGTEGRCDSALR